MTDVSVRSVSLDCLMAVTEEGKFLSPVLNEALKKYAWMQERDRAFISRLVHGTLEYMMQIDRIIERCSSVKLKKMKPAVRNILRLSVYQIFHMDRVPDRAVCFEAVNLTGKRGLFGLKGFVNGVLRHIISEREKTEKSIAESRDLSFRYSVPEWIADRLKLQYGEKTAEIILKAFLVPQPLSIRLSRAKRAEALELLKNSGAGGTVTQCRYNPDIYYLTEFDSLGENVLLKSGCAFVQDLSSSLAVKAADLKEGNTVFDVCAAPGGKSLYAADLLNGTGEVLSMDVSTAKTDLIRENILKSGLKNIRTEESDAAVYREELAGRADVVLADLPCSGLGVINGKPDIKLHASEEGCRALSGKQLEILNNVCRYVKPGGKLVYSTCTISREENEDNRIRFLKEHPEYSPLDFSGQMPEGIFSETLRDGYIQLLPGVHPCDGFFISVFKKEQGHD